MKLNKFERLDDLQFNNLYIIQNEQGYCFTSDAIALANFVRVPKNGKVVDLCSGSGVIGILVQAKNIVADVKLVELQGALADMSKRSIEYNKLENIEVINKPLQGVAEIIGKGVYDVVVCNPPYKKQGTATRLSENETIAIAKHELKVTLDEIVKESARLLKFGGDFYIVNKEERLTDILVSARSYGLEPKELVLLHQGEKNDDVIMVRARKGGKSGLKITVK